MSLTPVLSKAVVLFLIHPEFIVVPIVYAGSVFCLSYYAVLSVLSESGNHLADEERDVCFNLIVFCCPMAVIVLYLFLQTSWARLCSDCGIPFYTYLLF